jgi:YegS/Rv2252/BmrU family lipid kinase
MKRSACLIHNPIAGQGDAEAELQRICELLEPAIDLDIRLTTPEVGADRLAQKVVSEGATMVIASGGDGTISAVAEALVGTNIPLGIIARGTANAFVKALGIPEILETACYAILNGHTRAVDTARCNGKHMVLLTGVGFVAKMVERAERALKNQFGALAYVIAGVQYLREMEHFKARIETEDQVVTVDAVAVTVANAAPSTSILAQGPAAVVFDDGMLDVTILAPAGRAGAIAAGIHLLRSAWRGTATARPDISYLRARTVKVMTEPPQKVVMDGDLIGTTPVEIECISGGLTLLVPKLDTKSLNRFRVTPPKLDRYEY